MDAGRLSLLSFLDPSLALIIIENGLAQESGRDNFMGVLLLSPLGVDEDERFIV